MRTEKNESVAVSLLQLCFQVLSSTAQAFVPASPLVCLISSICQACQEQLENMQCRHVPTSKDTLISGPDKNLLWDVKQYPGRMADPKETSKAKQG